MPNHQIEGEVLITTSKIDTYYKCKDICQNIQKCTSFMWNLDNICQLFGTVTKVTPTPPMIRLTYFTGFKNCIQNINFLKEAISYDKNVF